VKIDDIPDEAFKARITPVPMRMVPDWDALYDLLVQREFIVLEVPLSDLRRVSKTHKAVESVTVKGFNNHVRLVKKKALRTKRITQLRWYCELAEVAKKRKRK
jgi:hypothetical protein